MRFIRSAYLQRIQVWAKLAQASLPPPPPAAEPAVVLPPAPPATVREWLDSPDALPLVRELRWALLPQAAAIARLRSARACGRSTTSSLLQALWSVGVPCLIHSKPSWGPSGPSWEHLIAMLERRCNCIPGPGVRVNGISICWSCRGAVLPPVANPARPCCWCRGSAGERCASCYQCLHFRGSCCWNRGAHAGYRVSGPLRALLCPDCVWSWYQSVVALPAQKPLPVLSSQLEEHMRNCTATCLPFAGSSSMPSPRLPLRRVRRWLLSYMRQAGAASPHELIAALASLAI